MPRGGKRAGAGKPVGTKNQETITKEAVFSEVRQRIMKNADKLLNAQMANALGSVQIFEVIEHKNSKGNVIRIEHRLVEDASTIKEVLDAGEGVNCSVDGGFYIVARVLPETKAVDSMFDRAFGKAAQSIEVKTDNDLQSLANRLARILVTKHGFTPEKAAQTVATEYNLPTDQIVIESVQ